MNSYIKQFKEIGIADIVVVGGKKIVSLDRWYYRLKYINSVKGEKMKRAGYLAILLGAKSKTGDDKKKP